SGSLRYEYWLESNSLLCRQHIMPADTPKECAVPPACADAFGVARKWRDVARYRLRRRAMAATAAIAPPSNARGVGRAGCAMAQPESARDGLAIGVGGAS